MKKIRKLLTIGLAILLMLCMSLSLVGCKKTGPIPNGHYGWSSKGENIYERTGGDIRDGFGWVIDGDTAEEWCSSYCDYKAKIVEKDGKIYFEGYKWSDPLDVLLGDGEKRGNTDVYLVEYDGKSSITLYLVVVPNG